MVDEVIEYAGLNGKPVKRILINENTPSVICKAVACIEDNSNYRGLSLSALARAVGDQRYGYNLTRCYTLILGDAPVNEKSRVSDAAFAKGVVNAVKGQAASLLSVKTTGHERAAPLPYNLLALQARCRRVVAVQAKAGLEITQRLHDRYQAITYNHSDCRYLNDERHEEAAGLLAKLAAAFGQEATKSGLIKHVTQ